MKYLILATALAMPTMLPASQPPAPAAKPAGPKIGATVIGKDNAVVGTIAEVTSQAVVVDTGTHRVSLPPTAVGSNPKGSWIGMTRAELEAAYLQAAQQAKSNFAASLTPGKTVYGLNGAMLGAIKVADSQFVTITTAKGDAKLPIAGFGPGPNDTVMVGLTAEQLEAAFGGAATTPSP